MDGLGSSNNTLEVNKTSEVEVIVKKHFVFLNEEERDWYDSTKRLYEGAHINEDTEAFLSTCIACNSKKLSELNSIDEYVSFLYRDAKTIPELYKQWLVEIHSTENYVCNICWDESQAFLISEVCGHIFCGFCSLRVLENGAGNCPFCRQILVDKKMFWAKKDVLDQARIEQYEDAGNSISSKVSKLLELLQRSAAKTVVMSNFESMLFLLRGVLKKQGYAVSLVMEDHENKTRIYEEFSTTPEPMILLTTYIGFEVDCDISAASKVYFMEPILTIESEEKAIASLACIMKGGNRAEVGMLVAKDTMEEKMIVFGDVAGSNLHKLFVRVDLR